MAKPVTHYTLKYPIEVSEEVTIDKVKVQPRIKGKHMRKVAGAIDEIDRSLMMVAAVTGLEHDIVDEMDEADIKGISEIIKKNRE